MYCALLEKREEKKKAKRLSVNDFMEMLRNELEGEWNKKQQKIQNKKKEERKHTLTEQQRNRRKKKRVIEEKGDGCERHFKQHKRAHLLNLYLANLKENP